MLELQIEEVIKNENKIELYNRMAIFLEENL